MELTGDMDAHDSNVAAQELYSKCTYCIDVYVNSLPFSCTYVKIRSKACAQPYTKCFLSFHAFLVWSRTAPITFAIKLLTCKGPES